MILTDIDNLIRKGESQTLELKANFDLPKVAEAVCALLNADGGRIILGVSDDGAIRGLEDAESLGAQLEEFLRKKLSPAATLAIVATEAQEKPLLLVDVPRGASKPYVFDGVILRRVGTANRRASADDIHELIGERSRADQLWERQPAIGMALEDMDQDEIRRTVREAVDAGRFDASVTDVKAVLEKLYLIVDGRPVQGAAVAFATEVMPWYPQCSLRLARFRGTTKEEFTDQKRVTGHAFRLLDEAHTFLARYLPIQGTFEPGSLRRKDQPLYPVLALREALVNAICHRDYSIAGGAISVAIFDDRVEIASTGTLPHGLTVADLKRDHYSIPRNPLLADVFYRRGLLELWGRGTQGIVRRCMDVGCPEPNFEERAGEFVVRLFSPAYRAPSVAGLDLTERQRRILVVLQDGAKRKLSQLKEEVDPSVSDTAFRNDLNRLRELGLAESGGFGRGAFWRLAVISPPKTE